MRRSLLAHGFCILSLLLTTAARAEVEYWIAVGSYKDLLVAENARREASAQLPETFSISQADTPSGFYYRVLAGPYLTREIADHMQSEALRSGFQGAWILATDQGSLSVPYASADLFPGTEPFDPSELEFKIPEYNVPASEPMDIPGFNVPVRPERSTEHILIDEAPADYHLNKLDRNQATISSTIPFILA